MTLDAATGQQKWKNTASVFSIPFPGPILLNPNTVLTCDSPAGSDGASDQAGYVFEGLNRLTGDKLWESRTAWKYQNAVAYEELRVVSNRKVHEVLTENNNTSPDSWLTVVSLRTGKELWRTEVVELGNLTFPAASGGMIVVGSEPFTFNSVSGKREVSGLWAWRVSQ